MSIASLEKDVARQVEYRKHIWVADALELDGGRIPRSMVDNLPKYLKWSDGEEFMPHSRRP